MNRISELWYTGNTCPQHACRAITFWGVIVRLTFKVHMHVLLADDVAAAWEELCDPQAVRKYVYRSRRGKA